MSEQEIPIKVNISDRFYPLRIPIKDEENVRNSVNHINERARFYTQNFSIKDKQDALAMVALEFASEKYKRQPSSDDFSIIDSKLKKLEQQLEI
jgi:hypothetical protein